MTDKPKPKANIRFIYSYCNDIPEMRSFYSDVLGMLEISHVDNEQFGWLSYQCEGLQFMCTRWDSKIPVEEKWGCLLGEIAEDSAPLMSFSLEYSFEDFQALVPELLKADVRCEKPKPTWRQQSYWGWTIKDPMGNTIEVYAAPKDKPEEDDPVWP